MKVNIRALAALFAVVAMSGCASDNELDPSNDPYNGHAYVDLGLSVKWATCNVGATTPEGYGDYFAWGEAVPYYTAGHAWDNACSNWKTGKTGYNVASYKWCEGFYLTKYCNSSSYGIVDNKSILDATDDAATANWGGSWRMPTKAERDELLENCTWTWTTRNGVNGYRVTSNTNSNSIFLPAAGYRYDCDLYVAGYGGYYWTSEQIESESYCANGFGFGSGDFAWCGNERYFGRSVRAVCP